MEAFYEQLETAYSQIKSQEIAMIMGDLNDKVGKGMEMKEGIGGYSGVRQMTTLKRTHGMKHNQIKFTSGTAPIENIKIK